jgi:hypothetical protein
MHFTSFKMLSPVVVKLGYMQGHYSIWPGGGLVAYRDLNLQLFEYSSCSIMLHGQHRATCSKTNLWRFVKCEELASRS